MAPDHDDDDLPLNRPTPRLQGSPSRQPSPLQWVLVGIAALVAGSLLAYWWLSRTQPVTAPPPTAMVAETDTESGRPKPQPLDLPSLEESDTLLRSLVSTLSQHPALARFLTTDGVARASTLAVVQIGDGRTPDQPLLTLRPPSRAQMRGTEQASLDPASYGRWDSAVGGLTSVAPADAAQLYVNVKPLLDEAYVELGYTDDDFDAALVRAIAMLRSAPMPAEPPALVERDGVLEYADPRLEALKPVQKQFLLIGPDNQRRVLSWLEETAGHLDLSLE
jgi:hypothetical protein